MAAIHICPYCEDLTEQTILMDVKLEKKLRSHIENRQIISVCHQCNQNIEHEQIIMQSSEYAVTA